MEEKICQNCGQHNDINAAFCVKCGNALSSIVQNNTMPNNNVQMNNVQTYNTMNQEPKTNGFAIASLVLGIISVTVGIFIASIWFPLLTITFSLTAKQKIKAFNQKGEGLATAGLVLGIIGSVIWIINIILKVMIEFA